MASPADGSELIPQKKIPYCWQDHINGKKRMEMDGVTMQSSKSLRQKMTTTNIFVVNQIVNRSGSQLMQLIQAVTVRVVNLNFILY